MFFYFNTEFKFIKLNLKNICFYKKTAKLNAFKYLPKKNLKIDCYTCKVKK